MKDRYWKEPTLGWTEAVRQHYVPKMLLARFAVSRRIAVYTIEDGRTFSATVNRIALASRFYDVAVARLAVSAETWLSQVEGDAAPVIERLVSNPDDLPRLSPADQNILARFICALRFRSPTMREIDDQLRQQVLDHVKQVGKRWLEKEEPNDAEEIWRAWSRKPDEWFLHEDEPYQPAAMTAFLLGEVQGFANILLAMPWRIGLADPDQNVYSSDNPVAAHPIPTYSFPGFAWHVYFLPLSPRVVLKIGPGLSKDSAERRRADFSPWETCYIRHVVTNSAMRHLYGRGPYIPKQCAAACLRRLDTVSVAYAVLLQGFDRSALH